MQTRWRRAPWIGIKHTVFARVGFRQSIPLNRQARPEASIIQREGVYREASRTASLGLGVNVFLVILKLVGGTITGSAALIADAINSVGDVASSLVVHGALWMAQQDEDDDHPYGHTKAESIGALSIAILIAFSAGMLAIENIRHLREVVSVPPQTAAIIAALCAVLKEAIYWQTRRVSSRIDSRSLQAAAWDHRSDAICSAAIAVALFAAPYLGPLGRFADPVAAILVCALLIGIGVRLFWQTALELMDQQADPELTDSIRHRAEEIGEVTRIEKLRVRKSGLEFFVDIHVEVDAQLTVGEGHRIGHLVKDELLRSFPRVRDVLVHVEPDD
ncbi:Ferrous-iron efflux pump FieF [Rosistilla ulvae]|uniref:Ferrous-iron efflux pump FieF n=1 Tax=Rosistilla ulvae TaxID=1930277 RepID=A0A517LTJ3_9BACT|nr:Ferrous-iron efflux pump FieF [Rosistilla ulvae]